MLTFQEFFAACAGFWTTERTYHFVQTGEIERSYTEFQVDALTEGEKQRILTPGGQSSEALQVDFSKLADEEKSCPGFAIAFDTVSDKGERVAMSLNALFIPDHYVAPTKPPSIPLPPAAEVADGDVIRGFYMRDEGYSESGAIAGRFTYQPTRQILEMTTHYTRSVAVDQMRLLSPNLRLRTIVTYQRPDEGSIPSVITLIGFGVEQKK